MKCSLLVIALFVSFALQAQDVVSWKFSAKKTADKTYQLRMTATLEDGWHIYSQQSPEGGPLPTKIALNKNPLIIPQGKVKEEGEMEMYHEEVFGVDVYSYSNKVDFVQTVKLKANAKTNISGSVTFMACRNGQCLTPETVKFNIRLE